MLESNYQWNWTDQCEEAFCKVKAMIVSDLVFTHYDPNIPIQLACDASPVGIVAVPCHGRRHRATDSVCIEIPVEGGAQLRPDR
jgi:hypothetical protein